MRAIIINFVIYVAICGTHTISFLQHCVPFLYIVTIQFSRNYNTNNNQQQKRAQMDRIYYQHHEQDYNYILFVTTFTRYRRIRHENRVYDQKILCINDFQQQAWNGNKLQKIKVGRRREKEIIFVIIAMNQLANMNELFYQMYQE